MPLVQELAAKCDFFLIGFLQIDEKCVSRVLLLVRGSH